MLEELSDRRMEATSRLQGTLNPESRPVLDVEVPVKKKVVVVGGVELSPADFSCLLRSMYGRGIIVSLKSGGAGLKTIADMPDWLREILVNDGFANFVPKLAPLQD